jgi:hypothetical protein
MDADTNDYKMEIRVKGEWQFKADIQASTDDSAACYFTAALSEWIGNERRKGQPVIHHHNENFEARLMWGEFVVAAFKATPRKDGGF